MSGEAVTTTFEEYLLLTATQMSYGTKVRAGQAYFNTLDGVNPALAADVRGTAIDPFYEDRLIPAFLNYVCDRWSA